MPQPPKMQTGAVARVGVLLFAVGWGANHFVPLLLVFGIVCTGGTQPSGCDVIRWPLCVGKDIGAVHFKPVLGPPPMETGPPPPPPPGTPELVTLPGTPETVGLPTWEVVVSGFLLATFLLLGSIAYVPPPSRLELIGSMPCGIDELRGEAATPFLYRSSKV